MKHYRRKDAKMPKRSRSSYEERARAAISVELARRDVNDFCEYAFRQPDDSPWIQQPFHREWQALLPVEGPARVLIGAPREVAKTTQKQIEDEIA